jgi:hypothetical protein
VNQIEKYFELHNIMDDKKMIHITTLSFEIKPYQWYQWIVKRKPRFYHYTWGLFTRDLEEKYGNVWEHDYLSQLTRIKHLGDIEDCNSEFQVLATRVDDIIDEQLLQAYMDGLKRDIKHELFLINPNFFMEVMQSTCHIEAKNKDTQKSTIVSHKRSIYSFGVHKTSIPQPTRLTPQKMDERIEKGLCFNCDSKYNKGHKFNENKFFYIDREEEKDWELEPPQDPDIEETSPTLSCHALVGINTPPTLKIQG